MENNKKKQQLITLRNFIGENYSLLTVLGVLGALFSLFYVIDFGLLDHLKSYIQAVIFIMFTLVSFEIWVNFPESREKVDGRLNLFEQFFVYFILLIIVFALYTFRDVIREFLLIILLAIYGSIANYFIKKNQLNKKMSNFAGKYAGWKSIIIRSLFFGVFLALLILAVYLSYRLISIYWPYDN